jgi:hypothetical protein
LGREKTMRGSEKQIKWATEIRDNVIKTYTEAIPILEDLAPNPEAYEKVKQLLTARIELLKDENIHAGDIIDIFKDIRFNGDNEHDLECVISRYRFYSPITQGQRKILMQ